MVHIMNKLIIIVTLIILSLLLTANVPAPWWACDGKKSGDPCTYGYGCSTTGRCELIQNCKDNQETTVNECLQCRTK